ncbi:MAG: YbaN family protein [Roseateles sp.]|uniref:YbaN family protein n=1 Tax=Roseateles sp. TaxID=1971397 RepID=UPI0039ED3A2D
MRQTATRLLWRAVALLSVALALLGVLLPGLPTVPFLLLAAWAGGKGWPALEAWLLNHPTHGDTIRRWRERGAVPRRAKWLATVMMGCSAVVLALSPLPLAARIALPALMAGVAVWLWRRPEA